MVVFLELNGWELGCSEAEETAMVLRAAAGEITEHAWTEWVRRRAAEEGLRKVTRCRVCAHPSRQLLARGWEHQLATGYWQLYYGQVAMRILSISAAEHALY